MNFAYIRVSTRGQKTDRQETALKGYADVENTYIDKATGKNFNRPEYNLLKKVLRSGDVLYIKSLDRLGRNKSETLKEIQWFKDNGILLKVLDIPTTMTEFPEGQQWVMELVNNIIIEVYTSIADNELQTIKSRQEEGIKEAQNKGVKFGRPTTKKPINFNIVADRVVKKEITSIQAMKELGLTKNVYYKFFNEFKTQQGLM